MKSASPLAFLSCSFDKADTELNNLFVAICQGLDIQCINVREGYKETPPEKAKQMISDAALFIAVAVKRNMEDDGAFTMPHAVHDEISMAFAKEKPMLILKETGVSVKGFLGNYGTFLEFDRATMYSPEFIRKAVSSIHTIKLDVVSSHDLLPDQDGSGFYQETMQALYELIKEDGSYTWKYSVSRKLVFTQKMLSVIRNSAWVTIPPEGIDPDSRIAHEVKLDGSNRPFRLDIHTDRDTPQCIETSFAVTPTPEKGDFLEVSHSYKSPYLNRISLSDTGDTNQYMIGDKSFHCFDGVVPIVRTQSMRCQFRFPKEYGLTKEDIFPFVGSYSAGIDYLVESEIKRAKVEIDDFGGNIIVDIRAESPLLRHVYGIAWRIPSK